MKLDFCHANIYRGIIYKLMPFSSTKLELTKLLINLLLKMKTVIFRNTCNNLVLLSFYVQVDDIGFSLNHPNQYFTESQKLLNGGREVKKEFNNSGNFQQKNNSQESTNSSSTPTSSNAKADTELEGLEAYFTED